MNHLRGSAGPEPTNEKPMLDNPTMMKTAPYPHQQEWYDKTKNLCDYAIFWEMGLGKSKLSIDTLVYNYVKGRIKLAIVVAKKGAYANWYWNELPAHCGCEYDAYMWQGLKTKKEKTSFERWLARDDGLKVMVFNFDAIKIKRAQEIINQAIKKFLPYAVIFDESTVIKNHKTQVFKANHKLAGGAYLRRILTGTPATESPIDLWGQLSMIQDNPLGYRNYVSFKHNYAIEKEMELANGTKFKTIVGYRNLDDLNAKLKPLSTHLTKEDELDLPPKIFSRVVIELTPMQQKAYDELKQIAITELQDETITAKNAVSLMVKLHQICSGQLKAGEDYLFIENNKIEVAREIIEEAQSKVIVWVPYIASQIAVYDALRDDFGAVYMAASLTEAQRQERIEEWKDPKGPKVMVANPKSLGHGVTLTEANTVIYWSNGWSLENRLQSEDRCHRIGQTKPVNYYDLVCHQTIDEKVLKNHQTKKVNQGKVLGGSPVQELKELINDYD